MQAQCVSGRGFRCSLYAGTHRPAPARQRCRAAAAGAPAVAGPAQRQRLLYDGIALDMDGTLTSCVIDFVDMRKRTGIPVGDLFVSMESWTEPDAIKDSMDVILEIEEAASKNISAKEGLLQLLALLRDSEAKVALVTRNTTSSVDAFFGLIGAEWRPLFSEIRTREFRYVKPDKRLLLELAQTWGIHPGKLLMVGDSHEDVECGNAAGTATCLIAGGGNEVGAAAAGPPPGAVPTFSVRSLPELSQRLLDTAPPAGSAAAAAAAAAPGGAAANALRSIDGLDAGSVDLLGWSLRSLASLDSMDSLASASLDSDDEAAPSGAAALLPGLLPLDPSSPGAPAPGLDFFDALEECGAIRTASTSFPRMGAAAGGLAACARGGGDSVVHVGCGDGGLTKMLASKGLRVWGVDADAADAAKRGLQALAFQGEPLAPGSLAPVAAAVGPGGADAALLYAPPQLAGGVAGGAPLGSSGCLTQGTLRELGRMLAPGGRLCVEVPLPAAAETRAAGEEARLREALQAAGFSSVSCLQVLPGWLQQRVRIVAEWGGGDGSAAGSV